MFEVAASAFIGSPGIHLSRSNRPYYLTLSVTILRPNPFIRRRLERVVLTPVRNLPKRIRSSWAGQRLEDPCDSKHPSPIRGRAAFAQPVPPAPEYGCTSPPPPNPGRSPPARQRDVGRGLGRRPPTRISLDRADLWTPAPSPNSAARIQIFSVMKQWPSRDSGPLQRLLRSPFGGPPHQSGAASDSDFPARPVPRHPADARRRPRLHDVRRRNARRGRVHANPTVDSSRRAPRAEVKLKRPLSRHSAAASATSRPVLARTARLSPPCRNLRPELAGLHADPRRRIHFAVYAAGRRERGAHAGLSSHRAPRPRTRSNGPPARGNGFGARIPKVSASPPPVVVVRSGSVHVKRADPIIQKHVLDVYKWGSAARRGAPPIPCSCLDRRHGPPPALERRLSSRSQHPLSYWPLLTNTSKTD